MALAFLLLGVLVAGPVRAQLNRYYYYRLTQRSYARGEFTEGIAHINVFLRYQRDDEVGLYLRALCKYELKDYRGSVVDLNRGLASHPFSVDLLVLRAACQNQLGLSQEAMRDIALALEIRPNAVNLVYMRGVTSYLLQNYDSAIADFSSTLVDAPSNVDARLNRGTSYLFKHDTLQAIADYQLAIHSNPFSPSPHIYMSRLELSRGRLDSALREINLALSLAPSNHHALLIKALIQHEKGDVPGALQTLDHSLRLSPRNSLALYNRALIHSERGELDLAVRDFDSAALVSPRNVYIRFNQGLTLLRMKRFMQADHAMSRAILLYPDFASAYAVRAEIRHALGDMAASKADYDKASELTRRYKAGELGDFSDTARYFSALMAFEDGFSDGMTGVLGLDDGVEDLLPLAKITVGQLQPHAEWSPVLEADSICGAPYFTLVVPSHDTSRVVDINLFPPLANVHAINLVRAISLGQSNDYESVLAMLDSVARWGCWGDLVMYMRAVTLIEKIRYEPRAAVGYLTTALAAGQEAYDEPKVLLGTLIARSPSPYLHYSLGTAHYLSRDLPAAEESLSQAIRMEGAFAEAYYNRGLVRLLLRRKEEGCVDLSRAGELGIDRAYRVIARECGLR